jgi:autotransporter-associated beta strand protein
MAMVCGRQPFVGRLVLAAAAVGAAVIAEPAAAQIQYLDNGSIRLGVDTTKGGAIVELRPSGTLASGSNVVNTFDLGREIQQSYYSGPASFVPAGATQHPSWSPWPWNPVQAGDAYGNRSTLISASNSGTELYVKSRPKQWALQNVDADCTMEEWITLSGNVATVRTRLTNARSDTTQYPARHQELPAVYTWARLTQLKTYTGTQPFTSGSLTVIPNAAPPWTSFRATEGWAAYVDANDWGLGVFAPNNVRFVGGFAGTPGTGSTTSSNTGYISPIRSEIIDHNIVYDHTYHLILGSLTSIRAFAVANKPDLKPDYQFRGTRDGWTYVNATDTGFPVTDRLRVNVASSDPQMVGPECSFAAADVPKLFVRVAASVAGATQASGRFYWERENGTAPMSAAQSQGFTLTADGQFRTYEVTLSATSTWTGQISRLRFDPVGSGTTGDFVEVQFISAYAPSTIYVDVASGTQTQAEARVSILTGTAGLTKTGAGTLSLTLSNTFTGPTRVEAGRLLVAHPQALASSTATVGTGAALVLATGVDATVRGLDLQTGGRCDLGNGSLTVTGSMSAVTALAKLREGRGDGTWSGTSGIVSSAIAADLAAGRSRTIGWLDNGGGSLTFAYAAPGDITLDGVVDILDVAGFLNGGKFDSGSAAVWSEGDFNYDGVIDVLDVAEFMTTGAYDAGPYTASSAPSAPVPVPEPHRLSVVALAVAAWWAARLTRVRSRPRAGGGRVSSSCRRRCWAGCRRPTGPASATGRRECRWRTAARPPSCSGG